MGEGAGQVRSEETQDPVPKVKTRRTDLVISECLKRKSLFPSVCSHRKVLLGPTSSFSCFSKTCYLSVWSSLLMILFKCSVFLLILGGVRRN